MSQTNILDWPRVSLNEPRKTRFFWPAPGKVVRQRTVQQGLAVPSTVTKPVLSGKRNVYGTPMSYKSYGPSTFSGTFTEGTNYTDQQLMYEAATQNVKLYAFEGFHIDPVASIFVWQTTGLPVGFAAPFIDAPYTLAVINPADPNYIAVGVINFVLVMNPIVLYNLYRRNNRGPFVTPADLLERGIQPSRRKLGLPYENTTEIEVAKPEDLTYYYKLTSFSAIGGPESPLVDSPLRIVKSAEEQYAWETRKRILGIEELATITLPVTATTWQTALVIDIVKDLGQVATYLKLTPSVNAELRLNNRNNESWVLAGAASQEWTKDDLAIIRALVITTAGAGTVKMVARL